MIYAQTGRLRKLHRPYGNMHATEFYEDFVEQGMGDLDFSAVIKQLKEMARD